MRIMKRENPDCFEPFEIRMFVETPKDLRMLAGIGYCCGEDMKLLVDGAGTTFNVRDITVDDYDGFLDLLYLFVGSEASDLKED